MFIVQLFRWIGRLPQFPSESEAKRFQRVAGEENKRQESDFLAAKTQKRTVRPDAVQMSP